MTRTLIIGYGNIDRADDGVAFFVVNALRRALDQDLLEEEDTGLEGLGGQVDSVFLHQLTPELLESMGGYGEIFFVDAHVDRTLADLHCSPVLPESAALTFTHHISPALLLAFLRMLYHRNPAAWIVSVRGSDFDFHRGLSEAAAAQVEPAVECILKRIRAGGDGRKTFD